MRAAMALRRSDEWDWNLGDCPWSVGYGYCVYGCQTEPACQTDRPSGGWPVKVRALLKCDVPRQDWRTGP